MRRRTMGPLSVAAAIVLVAGLTACGDDEETPETPGVTMTPTIPSTPSPTADDDPTGDAQPGEGAVEGSHTLASEVGEIDIEFTNGALTLQEVRPASGWQHRVTDEQSDEIDIDFRHDDGREVDVDFDVEDSRDLDISVDYERGLPDGAQTLTVSSIGDIEYEASGTTLTLIEVRPGAGWTHTVDDDDDDDEIEVDFRNSDGVTVEVHVEIDD